MIAFSLFERAAERGNPMAERALARFHALGEGVARDGTRAIHYLRLAADQGYAATQNTLGVAYQQGTGVAKDPAEAASCRSGWKM